MSRSPLLQLGYVSRAHGLGGEVGIRPFDPASETLYDVERVHLKLRDGSERTLALESLRSANKDFLVEFEGVRGRGAAEGLVGSTVSVFREDLEPPAEGEYFLGDLVGLRARDGEGRDLGRVEEVWETGPVPNLVVRGPAGEVIVPFVDAFVPTVDLEKGEVTIVPPEFLE
ncbi:MAG: rRNA processing protein RimM [Pseudomonadota bacterium]